MRTRSKSSTSKKTSALGKAKPVTKLQTVITALFYGRSGSGKTTVAATFPKPLLFLDIGERGTDSVANEDGVDSVEVTDWANLEDLYWELKEEDHGYKTVVIDSTHAMQAVAIKESKVKARKDDGDQTSQRDFGQASGLMVTWIPNFRDLRDIGINVVFLCHDRITEVDMDDEDDMITPEVGPRLMQSVASTLVGAVNVVGHTFIRSSITKAKKPGQKGERKVEYCMRVGPHPYYTTKIRKPKNFTLPEYIVDPTYDKLVNVIKGTTETTTSRRVVRRTKR